MLKCFRHQYCQPRDFKATLSILKIEPYNNVNNREESALHVVFYVFSEVYKRMNISKLITCKVILSNLLYSS